MTSKSPWSPEATEECRWWCGKRWSEYEASEIRASMQLDTGMLKFQQEPCRLARDMAEALRRTTREQWAAVPSEDLVRLWSHGLAVAKGIASCVPASIVDGDSPQAQMSRHLFYWLLVHTRASIEAVKDPYAVVEHAILYELAGPYASREFARRTRQHIGGAAGVLQFLNRTGAERCSTNVGRTIERELRRFENGVLGTVLRRRGDGRLLGRVGRLLAEKDQKFQRQNTKGAEVKGAIWGTIIQAVGPKHPMEALIESVNGKWNHLPQKAGWEAVNLTEREITRHAKMNMGDAYFRVGENEDSPQTPSPLAKWLRHQKVRDSREVGGPDEVRALRERLEQRVQQAITAAHAISHRFGEVFEEALGEVEGLADFRAELVQAIAARAPMTTQWASKCLRRLEKELGIDKL